MRDHFAPEKRPDLRRNDTLLVKYLYLSDGMKTGARNSSGQGLEYRGTMTFRRDAQGTLTFESVPFAAGRMTADGIRYHVTDHLGSVRAVLDGATGALLEASDYSAFGTYRQPQLPLVLSNQLASASLSAPFRHHFTGQEEQTGLAAPGTGTATLSLPYTDFGARHYSPTLSRWLVPDPLSEKYYDVSPYAYCANDPVNLVDPDGMMLFVGSYSYRDGELFNMDGSLLNPDEMDEYTKSVYDALQSLSKTKTGGEIISNLELSDFRFTIVHGEKSKFDADNPGDASGFGNQELLPLEMKQIRTLGSGGTVYWNEQGKPLITIRGVSKSPVTDLGHELAHAEDAAFGLQDNRSYKQIEKNEWQASYKENLMRQELGIPLRKYYRIALYPDGSIEGLSPLLINNGQPIRPQWY